MITRIHLASAAVLICLIAGPGGALAGETGTKTMPDSAVDPPPLRHPPVFDLGGNHYECYLPSEPCDNRHRVSN